MPAITKMQVETASELLKKKLEDKVSAIAEREFKAVVKKYEPKVANMNKLLKKIREAGRELKAEVEQDKRLKVDLDDYKLLRTYKRNDDDTSIIECEGSYYDGAYKPFRPNVKKQQEEIDNFILNLKLGNALMSDIQALITRLDAIK